MLLSFGWVGKPRNFAQNGIRILIRLSKYCRIKHKQILNPDADSEFRLIYLVLSNNIIFVFRPLSMLRRVAWVWIFLKWTYWTLIYSPPELLGSSLTDRYYNHRILVKQTSISDFQNILTFKPNKPLGGYRYSILKWKYCH